MVEVLITYMGAECPTLLTPNKQNRFNICFCTKLVLHSKHVDYINPKVHHNHMTLLSLIYYFIMYTINITLYWKGSSLITEL